MSIESDNAQLRAQIAELTRKVETLRRPTSYDERDALASAQVRADGVAQLFGTKASPPLTGESPMRYRARLLNRFKQHSPRFKDEHFDYYSDASMSVAEDVIYADATKAAKGDLNNGGLVPVQSRDEAGRLVTRFAGDPLAWMSAFMTTGHRGYINRPTPGKS
jgi:hypothetical protein